MVVPVDNFSVWSAEEIALITDGRWLTDVPAGWTAGGVAVSRKWCRKGDLFVTMDNRTWDMAEGRRIRSSGSGWDTANQLDEIRSRGAVGAIVQRDIDHIPEGFPVLRVSHSWKAVQALAAFARQRFTGRIIAVTGTSGKTTTREMIRHCLAQQGATRATLANYNTRAGVTLTVARLSCDMEYAIVEMAISSLYMNGPTLSDLVKPHIAIITSIAAGQIKNVSTARGTAVFKSRIFEGMDSEGTAIITRDSEYFDLMRDKAATEQVGRIWSFGDCADCALRLLEVDLDKDGSTVVADILGERIRYRVTVPGKAMVANSLATLGAVCASGADVRQAAEDLGTYKTLAGRLQSYKLTVPSGQIELLDDSYNATQLSMLSGFEVLSLTPTRDEGRKVALLGRIVYLEEKAEEIHRNLAEPLIASGASRIFTIGDEMKYLRAVLPQELLGIHASNARELAQAYLSEAKPGDVVLIKGSRRNSDFGRVVDYLREGERATPAADGNGAGTLIRKPDEDVLSRLSAATERRHMTVEKDWKQGFRIGLLGDTYFGEFYQERREMKGGENILKVRGYEYSLASIQPFVSKCDFTIANLEAALTDIPDSPFAEDKGWLLKGNAAETTRALSNAGIDAVTLGNNHSIDFGLAGLADTIDALDETDIRWFGAGATRMSAIEPLVLALNGRKRNYSVAFLSAYHYRKIYKEKFGFYATDELPGVATLEDLPPAISNISSVHDIVVVLPHWGQNYKWRSNLQVQQTLDLEAAGATVIIGHGAHMAQEIDFRGDSWVAYSLGNYVFNSFGEYAKRNVPPISLLACLNLEVEHNELQAWLSLYPVISDNLRTGFQPQFASYAEAEEFWDILRSKNELLNRDSEYAVYETDELGHCLTLKVL